MSAGRWRHLGALCTRVLTGGFAQVLTVEISRDVVQLRGPNFMAITLDARDPAWEIEPDGRISWPERRSGPGITPGPADLATGDQDKPKPSADQAPSPAYHQAADLTSGEGKR